VNVYQRQVLLLVVVVKKYATLYVNVYRISVKTSLSVLLLFVLKFPNVARLSENVWKSIFVYLWLIAWLIYVNKSNNVLNKFINALVILAIKFVIVLHVYANKYINV